MSTRKLRQKDGAVYFATFTCHKWVPLFHELNAQDVVYNWMNIAHEKGYRFLNLRRVCPRIWRTTLRPRRRHRYLVVDVNPQTPAEGWCRVGYKRMDYAYDLVSGNVNEVHYQDGQWDEFHHRYRYDADNRLLEVQTSRDGILWEREARQF